MVTHTISRNVVLGLSGSGVSANHCQRGSNILIYDIQICANSKICTKTIKNKHNSKKSKSRRLSSRSRNKTIPYNSAPIKTKKSPIC